MHSNQLDADRSLRYDANRKSVLAGYAIWFFLGMFGIHRMYLDRWFSGLAMLALHGFSWLTWWIGIGILGFGILGLWWLIDALLIPGIARRSNNRLADEISRGRY